MSLSNNLPDEYLQPIHSLEESYLQSSDPIRQSGFGGGAERWRDEREPILDAVQASAAFNVPADYAANSVQ